MPDDEKPNAQQDPLFEIKQGRQIGVQMLAEVQAKYRGRRFRSIDKLQAAVEEQCLAEFIVTWGVRFTEQTREFFLAKIEAQKKQIETEREARSLYIDLRNVALRLDEFHQKHGEYSGGFVARLLARLAIENIVPPDLGQALPALHELPWPPALAQLNATSAPTSALDRLVLVWALIEGGLPLFRPLTRRELAVISLLLGVGWKDRADAGNRFEGACKNSPTGVSVATVLKDETARIKAIRLPPDLANRLNQLQQAIPPEGTVNPPTESPPDDGLPWGVEQGGGVFHP